MKHTYLSKELINKALQNKQITFREAIELKEKISPK